MPIQEKPGTAKQGSSTTFLPTSVGNCVLWLDGKDPAGTGTPPSTGATVSTWTDKAAGKNAAATGSPTYVAGGGINFNGAAYFLNQTFSQNLSQRSIFIIMQETVHNGVYGVFPLIPTPSSGIDYQTTTGLSVETSNGLRFYGNGGSYQSDLGNASLLVKAIYNDNMNGTAGSGYLNGTNATNATAGYTAGTCSGYGVAARWSGNISTSYSLNGVIYEILFFNTPLSVVNRRTIEGYLAQKWGLTASLPVGHPGLTNNYLTTSTAPISYPIVSIAARPQPKFIIGEKVPTQSGGAGYTPASSGTLSVWLDASATATLTLSGANVTAWVDKSTNTYSAIQNNSLGYPTYTAAAGANPAYVNFSPNQALRIPSRPYVTTWTLFVAMNSVTIQARWFISPYSSVGLVMMGMAEPGSKIYSGLLPGAPSDITGNHIEMTTAQNTSTSGVLAWFRDGTQQVTNTTNANIAAVPGAALGIGANASGDFDIGGQYQIYELILYNAYLDTTQRQKVEGYLAWKWGLQASLPGGHPYASAAPTS